VLGAGAKRITYKWNVQKMFLFMLIRSLRLPSLVTDASPFSPRHLQSSSDSQYDNMDLEGVGASCSFSFQEAGGGADLWFPNGELVGDRYQIVLARTYILCEDTPGRMSI